jgi:3-hydroxymyristoyl/3-hydroxydecanoyl-(acyl carrier protein) dehydratase
VSAASVRRFGATPGVDVDGHIHALRGGAPVSATTSLHPLCIGADHPSLAGHFPGNPLVPGVLILDAVLAAAISHCGRPLRLQRLPQVKFLQPLRPGEAAQVELELASVEGKPLRLRFRVLHGASLLASGELALAA